MNSAEFRAMLNDPEQGAALVDAVNLVMGYNSDIDSSREAIKDTMDELCATLNVEKAEAASIKKYVKKTAVAIAKQQVDDLLADQTAVEMLIAKLDNKMSSASSD